MKKVIKIAVFIGLVILLAGAAPVGQGLYTNLPGLPGEIKKSFDVTPDGKLEIDLETGASIEVVGWDKDVVEITYSISGRDAELVSVSIEKTSNGVEVSSEYSSRQNNFSTNEEIVAKVPKKYNLEFKTMGGGVKLTGIEGKMEGTTMGGELMLKNLSGKLDLVTMGGEISLTDSKVDGKVKTMGGEVRVENVEGNVKATSMGGKVIQKNVKNSSIAIGDDEVNISTMGGSIEVDDAPFGANVKTMGGDIDVNSVKKFLKAETMGGDITVKSADAKIKCKTMGGNIYIKVDSDDDASDRDIRLTSMSGGVELVVPENFSMDIEVRIRVNEDDVDYYDIVSDFGLVKEIKNDDHNGWSNHDQKVIYATKSVNGGKNKVVISTVNGNVKIKKS